MSEVFGIAALDGFVRMCGDGWLQGWHECNGGNLSYRLGGGDRRDCVERLALSEGEWSPLSRGFPGLGGSWFLVTGSGKFMRNVATDPEDALGLIELDGEGLRWRPRWGLAGGGRPTSELATHLTCLDASPQARVVYHAHVPNICAMTFVAALDDRTFTRALWKSLTESSIVFPEGFSVLPWMPPSSERLADASSRAIGSNRHLVVWAHHGALCVGATFDEAFGRMHTAEKAAGIYLAARQANGGSDAFASTISDSELRELARSFGLALDEAFLDA